ncbi:MAG: Gldg family protein [Planctomycetota bacterium]|nr:Gldg family protein [Planctomycetota bacterium]
MNFDAVVAIWKRQVGNLLLNPLGYVYILAFVAIAAGLMFLPDAYYARNIADLEPLQGYMPWMLVVLLPALAMGSWASERELGTEEQLFTLPMTVGDALIGKWLGVVTFFTLALAIGMANTVIWIGQLGAPDFGLLFANFAGWWLAGLAFASLSILASSLVALPAIGFVLGVGFCSLAMIFFWAGDWFDPFHRGLIPFGGIVLSAVAGCLGLGLAALLLSSRRWPPSQKALMAARVVFFVCAAVTLGNLSVQADRKAVDLDATSEKLSSLSAASRRILEGIKEPVTVTAFISRHLPAEMALKGKEVENTLKVLTREMGGRMRLDLRRPSDPLDPDGTLATQQFGFTPRKVFEETAAGRDETDVFLGAAVRSGARMQRIDHFDPGLSVEYELVRAIRMAASEKKKTVGVVATDLKVNGAFDYMSGMPRPPWEFVGELRKQYEIREVSLETPVDPAVDVLVVAQPSRLGPAQVAQLHDYIWDGRPALILEDPLPVFSGPELASSQPKTPQNPMMPQQQPPQELGDLQPLFHALGLRMDFSRILWSDYNPSHEFRNRWERSIVWSYRDLGGVRTADATTGIDGLLFPWPGAIRVAPDKDKDIAVTPLVQPVEDAAWGTNAFSEHIAPGMRGMRKRMPESYVPDKEAFASIAVEVQGRMKRAYPRSGEPKEADAEAKSGEAKSGEAKDEKKTDEAGQPEPKSPAGGLGEPSAKPVHVIVIADTDFAHDQFFLFYRNEDNRFSPDQVRYLSELRNVPFVANCVDVLAGDNDLVSLRTRRPTRRPLAALEKVVTATQKERHDVETKAEKEAKEKIKALNDDFDERLKKIDDLKEYDENTKEQMKAQVRGSAYRQLELDIQEINRSAELKMRDAKIEQQRAIDAVRFTIRAGAIAAPSALLIVLAVAVFVHRLWGESLGIPESRRRKDR